MFKNIIKGILISQIFCCSLLFASLPVTEGLVLHLDAHSITGVSDGSPLGFWADLSGVGNHAVQATAGVQPVYRAAAASFHGLPVVHFDGLNDWMTLPSTTVSVGSFTAFAVARYELISRNQYLMAGQNGSGDNRIRFAVEASSSPVFEYRAGSSGWKEITAPADLKVHLFAMTSVVEGFLDGVSLGRASNTSSEYPAAFNIGSYNRGQKDFFAGDLAELIIFNRVLSRDEQSKVGFYLGTKYGLNTAYVPTVHSPVPPDGSRNVSVDAGLQWQPPAEVENPVYNVYFGTAETFPVLVSQGQTESAFDPFGSDPMQPAQVYLWRVDIEGISEGAVWSFTTRSPTVGSLEADINEDSIVDIQDLSLTAQEWLESSVGPADIDKSGKVDYADCSHLSSAWKKEGPFPAGYVISRYNAGDFKIAYEGEIAAIYVDGGDYAVCQIAADCLANDIELACGTKPAVVHSTDGLSGSVIFIGTLGHSAAVDALAGSGKIHVSDLTGQWETFALEVVDNPMASVERGLVIAGSDRRGTAYGVFDLSETMGVSPWFWWADVPVLHRERLVVRAGRYKQGPPSVKYRGIFINDEDWGLHPWARKTYAPEDGYIGPKTYRKVFELLLRLKANHLWPAMHDCTKAFNAFEDNKVIAEQYAIVMGSSHCEQMLRNNVWEWNRWTPSDGSSRGNWDWCTNSAKITEYWEERVKTNAPYENIYTTGMRGIHDSGMPCSGASNGQKVQIMQGQIFPAQRQMLAEWVHPDPRTVPQIFCPYKEVLDLYNLNMQVPDDITLVWPDDNHGYIRRLSNSAERGRGGRSGVYYHLSYWGSPHDYLWLCSTPPALIWEEMKKAYDYTADRVWIFNVGDIKPAEICMEFALRMAWDIDQYDHTNIQTYLEQWARRQFGPEYKEQIAEILADYYRLGQTRKPEHMATYASGEEFSLIHYGDEAQRRIEAYKDLEARADAIYQSLPAIFRDAFYQTILYPIRGASLMNQKILYAKKSVAYASQGRVSANEYAAMAEAAYNQILAETDYYNNKTANGKWRHIMSCKPRGLAVFEMPSVGTVEPVSGSSMGVIVEGQTSEVPAASSLPTFDVFTKNRHFIDIFNKGDTEFVWAAVPSAGWIRLEQTSGTVKGQDRIWVSLDWAQVPLGESSGSIEISGAGRTLAVHLAAFNPESPRPEEWKGFVQSNGFVSIEAEHYSRKTAGSGASWETIKTLGRSGDTMTVFPTTVPSRTHISDVQANSPCLEYQVYLWDAGVQKVKVYCIPTHAITSEHGLRYAVAFDEQTPQIIGYDTAEWSSQWTVNVLQGAAVSESTHTVSAAGRHTLKIWMVDAGVVIDKIVIGNAPAGHMGPPETTVR